MAAKAMTKTPAQTKNSTLCTFIWRKFLPKLSEQRVRILFLAVAKQKSLLFKIKSGVCPEQNEVARYLLGRLRAFKGELTETTPISSILPPLLVVPPSPLPIRKRYSPEQRTIANEVLYGKGSNSQIRNRCA